MKRAVGYIRVSKEKEEGLSPETQREKIEQYTKLHELDLVEIYQDLDYTGRNDRRPRFQQMLQDVQARKFDVVLVYKLDRFARSVTDFHRNMGILDKADCSLVSISQNIDTSTPVGRLLRNVLIDFAQFESEMIAERVRDNLIHNARKGRRNGGNAPFGYRWDSDQKILIPDPVMAPIAQQLFEQYATGTGAPSLARWLNTQGIRPPVGGRIWRHDAVLYILDNKVYIGINTYDGEEHQGEHEPLVSKELFDQVQRIRARQLKEHGSGREGLHLLAHLCRCGICGSPFNSRIQGPTKQRRLRCEGRRTHNMSCASYCADAETLEKAVSEAVLEIADCPEVIEEVQRRIDAQANEEAGPLQKERTRIVKELGKLESAQKEAFADYYLHKILSRDQFTAFTEDCEKRRKEMRVRLEEIDMILEGSEILKSNLEILKNTTVDLRGAWDHLTLAEQREALRSIVNVVRVHNDRIEVDFGFFQKEIPRSELKRGVTFF